MNAVSAEGRTTDGVKRRCVDVRSEVGKTNTDTEHWKGQTCPDSSELDLHMIRDSFIHRSYDQSLNYYWMA